MEAGGGIGWVGGVEGISRLGLDAVWYSIPYEGHPETPKVKLSYLGEAA